MPISEFLQVRNPTGWCLMWTMVVMKPYLHLRQTHGKLPDMVTAVTGSGGRHYVFIYSKGRSIPNKTKFAPGLDTRSTGGLIVVAPSIHVSGNRYEWIKDYSPLTEPRQKLRSGLLMLMEAKESMLTPFDNRIERAAVFLQQLMKAAAIAP